MENIIENYDLILNNEPGVLTRLNNGNNKSIIDLTFTTTEIGLLKSWSIDKENSTPSDHKLIVFKWLDLNLEKIKSVKENID